MELPEPLELDAPRRLVQTWPDGPEICLNLQSMMTAHYYCQKGFGPKALSQEPIMGSCLSLTYSTANKNRENALIFFVSLCLQSNFSREHAAMTTGHLIDQ